MYTPARDVIATDLQHELILLDPRNGEMFGLNATGRRVWLALPASGAEQIAAAVIAEFDVTPEQAHADVQSLLAVLEDAGLIERLDEG